MTTKIKGIGDVYRWRHTAPASTPGIRLQKALRNAAHNDKCYPANIGDWQEQAPVVQKNGNKAPSMMGRRPTI